MDQQQRTSRAPSLWTKIGGIAIVVLLIFTSGVAVGKGTITFGARTSSNNINGHLPEDLDYKTVEDIYDRIKADYDGKLDSNALLDGIKKGLAEATGDPYTQYFNAAEAKKFEEQLNGSFTGIGAELEKNKDGAIVVVSPIANSPAEKAGVRAKDIIVAIDKDSAAELSIDEAVSKIRGAAGTEVGLTLLRNGAEKIDVIITRAEIKQPSVDWEIIDGTIGYLRVNRFSDDTTVLASQAAREFTSKGVKNVLLDLRGNPGGLRDEAISLSSLWLDKGKTVMQEKHGDVVTDTFRADGNALLKGMRTAVLINGGSASASEITAGALKDNTVATLFGEKSYGKGKVQEVIKLPGGAELKITTAHWFRPNGENIDQKGIDPDTVVERTQQDTEQQKDPQKDAALNFLKGQ